MGVEANQRARSEDDTDKKTSHEAETATREEQNTEQRGLKSHLEVYRRNRRPAYSKLLSAKFKAQMKVSCYQQ
jgi:hypothetical protein